MRRLQGAKIVLPHGCAREKTTRLNWSLFRHRVSPDAHNYDGHGLKYQFAARQSSTRIGHRKDRIDNVLLSALEDFS